MSSRSLAEVIASPLRVKIAALISERPRPLGELAELTGISVQGVLKHLKRLEELGLASERFVARGGEFTVRKVYEAKGPFIQDFSTGGIAVVKVAGPKPQPEESEDPVRVLESLAEETIVRKRRIRDQVRRATRQMDELAEATSGIGGVVNSLGLREQENLVLRVVFTEDTKEAAERVLLAHYGLSDPGRSIAKAMSSLQRARHRRPKREQSL